ncbi:nucleoside diphosphate kinase regulator [Hoeflea sp. YIM 152468]|uniref:nucleoside diphosphate kinase regulator n=1 Tax=Hoeflea sp. YIM 152468 TaxID=3031759 RepID=UPI0023D9FECA|nr:nucleoside diphosphate kinase regulator [Hoeflea sp. YIM 152468]MDF1609324.1 nucleoside diphosphate kinase regulator [Hoeflea sp. YIM 152468]
MAPSTKRVHKPAITMTRSDHERLSKLAETLPAKTSFVADQLFVELDRARIVADGRISSNIVRMGSSLRFTSDLGEDRSVTLVFPGEADIAKNRISIFTPIGTALIGLSAGQSIDWTARDGRVHRLTVESVTPPSGNSTTSESAEVKP